jgi:hypothetical protein
MLVYEYMENSNLEKWLHHDDGEVSQLSWDTRMHILLGTAKGYVIPSSFSCYLKLFCLCNYSAKSGLE